MIGVAVQQSEWPFVEEFFQLFKTPWEPARASHKYKVVLTTEPCLGDLQTDVLLMYGSRPCLVDRDAEVDVECVNGPTNVEWDGHTLPIYGRISVFKMDASAAAVRAGGRAVDYQSQSGTSAVRRIGYDLFDEVRRLLSDGQPASNALTPALELHIALLRSLLLESNVSFVEIPPRPHGRRFICCLTHDIDFFGIRRHQFDRTLGGFIARASVGALIGLARGTRTSREAFRNWGALLSLPLVFFGLRRDFWQPFRDYGQVEAGHPSTFFLVPFKQRPGVSPDGTTDPTRAVAYEIREIRDESQAAAAAGAELGVHGIDAWRDAEAGRTELEQLASTTGQSTVGIRMHWLYFAADSPGKLEAAGFDYDSTCGYNDAVGYRAGTSQVFRLPGTRNFMELPMSIMDTALFYPGRMGLSYEPAWELCRTILANVRRWGGTIVVNWHCRSLAPERLWGRFYQRLLTAIDQDEAWFATAGSAVDWFRWRRSISFASGPHVESIAVSAPVSSPGPAAVILLHRPAGTGNRDLPFDGAQPVAVTL
jgi:hypothetical protein